MGTSRSWSGGGRRLPSPIAASLVTGSGTGQRLRPGPWRDRLGSAGLRLCFDPSSVAATISIEQARRLALHAQGLALPPPPGVRRRRGGRADRLPAARPGRRGRPLAAARAARSDAGRHARLARACPRRRRLPRARASSTTGVTRQASVTAPTCPCTAGRCAPIRRPDPAVSPGVAPRERGFRRAHGRGARRGRAAASLGARGPLRAGLGVGPLDRGGLLAADDCADARPALDDGPDRGRRPGRDRASLGSARRAACRRGRWPLPTRSRCGAAGRSRRRCCVRSAMLGVARAPHINAPLHPAALSGLGARARE